MRSGWASVLVAAGAVLCAVERAESMVPPITNGSLPRCAVGDAFVPVFCTEVRSGAEQGLVALELPGDAREGVVAAYTVDAAASDAYQTLSSVLTSFPCERPYGVGNCNACRRAYRRWACSRFSLCTEWEPATESECNAVQFNGTQVRLKCKTAVRHCDDVCWDVVRSCPPSVRAVFKCPETPFPGITWRSLSKTSTLTSIDGDALVPILRSATTQHDSRYSGCFSGWDGGGGGVEGIADGSVGRGVLFFQ
jgi:hypothetical protein